MPCRLRSMSGKTLEVQLDRGSLHAQAVIVVDLKNGKALDARVTSAKGSEVRLEIVRSHDLSGLVPARLGRARDIWKRARP